MRFWRKAPALAVATAFLATGLSGVMPGFGAGTAGATGGTSVTPGTVGLSASTAGSNSTYTIPFTTSGSAATPTGAISGSGTVTLTAATGTFFTACSNCGSLYTVTDSTGPVATVSSANLGSGANQIVLSLTSASIPAGDNVTVTANQVTNPQTAGAYSMQESTSADTTAASAPYSITSNAAARITATQPTPDNEHPGQPFPALKATVVDSYGNPVAGQTVTFTAPGSGASGTFASCPANPAGAPNTECVVDTDSTGVATASTFTANSTTGSYQVDATTPTISGPMTAVFSLSNAPTAVAPGPVVLSNYQEAASGVTYNVGFTPTTNLPSGGTITLTGPDDTEFPAASCDPTGATACSFYTVTYGSPSNNVFVGNIAINNVPGPGQISPGAHCCNQVTITIGSPLNPASIPAGQAVTVTVTRGVTNPLTTCSACQIEEQTSADPGDALSGTYPIDPGPAAKILAVAGDNQHAVVANQFSSPLTVQVEDSNNNAVGSGVNVVFHVPAAAAGTAGGTWPGPSTTDQTDPTGANGQVTSSFITADTVTGTWMATATLTGASPPSVSFSLTNDPGPAAQVVKDSGDAQTPTVGTAMSALSVTVKDQYGNVELAGVPVTFTALSGQNQSSASFAGSNKETDNTDSSGVATSTAPTANHAAGQYTITAMAGTGSASFSETNLAGAAAAVVKTGGDGQSATVGQPFASPFSAEVTDQFGNPVAGACVGFGAPASGATGTFAADGLHFQFAPTGPNGVATTSTFTANAVAGSYQVGAGVFTPGSCPTTGTGETRDGSVAAVAFSAANTVGPSSGFVAITGSGQSAHLATLFGKRLQARVTDALGNPIAGHSVTFSMPSINRPTGLFLINTFPYLSLSATVNTGADGVATSPPFISWVLPGRFLATASTSIGDPTTGTVSFPLATTDGYWLAGSNGSIQAFGDARNFGSPSHLNKPIVAMAAMPDGSGYWLVATDGGIFNYGHAGYFGSEGNKPLNKPIVGMAATPDGGGYWLVASDGGIFTFGDATYFGSEGNKPLNKPIVGMAATPDGGGYWLVASDGGIFTFGDAGYFGSTGAMHLNQPIVGMAPTVFGNGYWLVARDGGIFTFGDARYHFYGSTGNIHLNQPIVGMTPAPSSLGYWFVAHDGGVFAKGPEAPYYGSGAGAGQPVVAMAEG